MALPNFEPATNGPSWYVPYPSRPNAPVLPRRYRTEKAACAALEAILEPYFDLYSEVRVTETGYAPQYIDYVAVFKDADAQSSLRLIGIEAKNGFDEVKEACAAIRQAMRYRKARISDARLSQFLGDRIPYIVVWPSINLVQDTSWCDARENPDIVRAEYVSARRAEARALYLAFQHWNIGWIDVRPWWSNTDQDWQFSVTLMNGQQQVWTSRYIQQITDGFRAGLSLAADPKRGLRYVE